MSRKLSIRNRLISDDMPCYVIAEIGHNHQGHIGQCLELFREAKNVGVDAVKLQKRENRSLYTREFYDSLYKSPNAYADNYGAHREALEFGEKEFRILKNYAEELDITFFATPFDFPSVDFLYRLDMPAYKIASGDLRNTPLIRRVAGLGKPVIISTGASNMADVEAAVRVATVLNHQVSILQCTSAYPVNDQNIHLAVIESYRSTFPDLVIGYSGHDLGISASLFAIAHGARIVEKHFTLDKKMKGTDHSLSLNCEEMAQLVKAARSYAQAYGSSTKVFQEIEKPALYSMGKKLVAARDIQVDAVIEARDIDICSPGDGIMPNHFDDLVGRKVNQTVRKGQSLAWEMMEKI